MSELRVVHCAETIKGGIASYLRELLPLQLASFGSGAVAVIVPASQLGELPLTAGVQLLAYPDDAGRVVNAFRLAKAVRNLCQTSRPDVVHIHSTFAGASVRVALALSFHRPKVVYCAHGWAWDRPTSKMARFATKLVERLLVLVTDKIVCISEHERRSAIESGLPVARLRVVLNGVAASPPAAIDSGVVWPQGNLRLLFVGRFDHQKGADLLCASLVELGSQYSAVFAGGSVLADGASLKLPANALAAGWLTPAQLESLFEAADMLVMPSRWEGFGLIAVEAMRAGLPVLASRVGGLGEVVVDGETGWLIEPNSATAITNAIRNIDRADLSRFGTAGKSRFKAMFKMERVHGELCEVYGF